MTTGNSVASIGSSAFSECVGLKKFIVSEENSNYSMLDDVLFNKDKTTLLAYPNAKLDVYFVPNSVTSIGSEVFYKCTGLTIVKIGNSITSIGNAFSECTRLSEIHSKNPVPPSVISSSFYNIDKTICKLYVPKGSYAAYWLAPVWSEFNNIIEEEIGKYLISVSYNTGGKVLINDKDILNSEIEEGKFVTFTIVPNEGYEIDKAVFNDKDITTQVSNNTFVAKVIYTSVFEVSFKKTDVSAINTINKDNITIQSISNGIAKVMIFLWI